MTFDGGAASPLDWGAGDLGTLRRSYLRMRRAALLPGERSMAGRVPGSRAVLLHAPSRTGRRGGGRHGGPAAILYFHGGGWYLGGPQTHAAIGRQLTTATGLLVHSLDYRLLPGHSAAAPVRDGLALLRRLAKRGTRRFVLAGDSAGAGIALAVARALEAPRLASLLGIVAFYGAYGLEQSPSIARFGRQEEGLDAATVASYYRRLRALTGSHPYRVELLAGRRLPPLQLFVGGCDPVLCDNRALLAAARGRHQARLTVVPEAGHGYLHDPASPAARRTMAATAQIIANWLRR